MKTGVDRLNVTFPEEFRQTFDDWKKYCAVEKGIKRRIMLLIEGDLRNNAN